MALANGSQGPHTGRPQAQTQTQWGQQPVTQPTAQQNYGHHGFGTAGYGQGQAAPQPGAPAYPQAQVPQQGYGYQPQDFQYPQGAHAQEPHYGQANAGYAPQFEPYAQPAPQTRAPQSAYPQAQAPAPTYAPQAPAYGHQAQQWAPQQQPQHDTRGFDLGTYLPQNEQPQEWGQPAGYHGEMDQTHANPGDMGFAQAHGGELDQGYSEDEVQDYEAEAPRSRRPFMMVAALAGAIIVGGGLAYGYKAILGGGGSGEPPVVKSAEAPSKIKPADGGGKQFAHTDSKIMGRLGEGSGSVAAGENGEGQTDASGTRKVATLVVGRDGSIQAPAAAPAPVEGASVSVPGMTVVDGLGAQRAPAAAAQMAAVSPQVQQRAEAVAQKAEAAAAAVQAAPQKVVVTPPAAPPAKPVVVAKAAPVAAAATGSIDEAAAAVAPAPAPKPKKVKTAAAAPAAGAAPAAPVTTAGGGSNGFVAVLASVPVSDSSRMTALKQFADLQQKYGGVLGGKTPDVAEANLGQKGAYHRLVVGPPGSREQAAALCSDLKAQGYAGCWVTGY